VLPIFLAMLETPEEKQNFTELYETNRGRMFSVARGVLKDDYLAEDAVNQAFLRLLRHFKKCDELSSDQTRNYLAIIVRNAALDMRDERRRIAEVPFDEERDSDGRYDGDSFDARLDYDALVEAIDRLPEIYSEALYLSYHLGLSVGEIAGALDISNGAVKQRLTRARQKLRAALEGVKEQ